MVWQQTASFVVKSAQRNQLTSKNEDWQAADSKQSSQSATPWDGTDKHKLLWLCHLPELLEIIKQNSEVARSAPATSSSAPPGLAQKAGQQRNSNVALVKLASKLWETGSLHIVTSAPRQEYSPWRMTFEPAVKLEEDQVEAEYLGILLQWVGPPLFYHNALRKAAFANTDNRLGPLAPLFHDWDSIRRTRPEEQALDPMQLNYFHGCVTEEKINLFQKLCDHQLAEDQLQVIKMINTTAKSMFRIEALAETGKSKVLLALLYAVWDRLALASKEHAVVVCLVPSRVLREETVHDACKVINAFF